MPVLEIKTITGEVVQAFERLLPQLSATSRPPTFDELAEMVALDRTILLAATQPEDGSIAGMLALVLYRIPTGLCARIEDVVVDAAARGQGLGAALITTALEYADRAGVKHVDLTSHPEREAANRLYRRLGFMLRETNVYRFQLTARASLDDPSAP